MLHGGHGPVSPFIRSWHKGLQDKPVLCPQDAAGHATKNHSVQLEKAVLPSCLKEGTVLSTARICENRSKLASVLIDQCRKADK